MDDRSGQILSLLKTNNGLWMSDAELAQHLPTATELGEIIKNLQTEGYPVEGSPGKGYRFNGSGELSREAVLIGLKTTRFGHQGYYHFKEIDSTNRQAQRLADQGAPEGTVVVAEMQTSGRGRRGRVWFSPSHLGIYMTVILRPNLPLAEVSRVSLVAAVAVAETMQEKLQIPAGIKWPNDILIKGRKIAGILSEAAISGKGMAYLVTGIGINVGHELDEFPGDLRTAPTSVAMEGQADVTRAQILRDLLQRLEKYYLDLLNGEFAQILERGRRLSLAIGHEVSYDTLDGNGLGMAIDLDENGSLLVQDEAGEMHTVISGEVIIEPIH